MAATLDDLLYVATAIRIDLRNSLDSIEKKLTGRGGRSGGTGTPGPAQASAPTPTVANPFATGLMNGLSRTVILFGAMEHAITKFGNQLTQFVEKANPAIVQRWRLALDDAQAVIGRALIPLLERMTLVVRRMADAFASLSPQTQRFVASIAAGAGIGAVLATVTTAFRLLTRVMGPIPAVLGAMLGALSGMAATETPLGRFAAALGAVVEAIGTIVTAIGEALVPVLKFVTPLLELLAEGLIQVGIIIRSILDTLGLAADYRVEEGKSVGAAVRRANISSIESFSQRNIMAAYQGGVSDIPRESLTELKGIRSGIDGLPGKIGDSVSKSLAERLTDRSTPGKGTPADAGRRWVGTAAAGAAIGSIVPGVGTGLGAAIGGTIGIMRELFS